MLCDIIGKLFDDLSPGVICSSAGFLRNSANLLGIPFNGVVLVAELGLTGVRESLIAYFLLQW